MGCEGDRSTTRTWVARMTHPTIQGNGLTPQHLSSMDDKRELHNVRRYGWHGFEIESIAIVPPKHLLPPSLKLGTAINGVLKSDKRLMILAINKSPKSVEK